MVGGEIVEVPRTRYNVAVVTFCVAGSGFAVVLVVDLAQCFDANKLGYLANSHSLSLEPKLLGTRLMWLRQALTSLSGTCPDDVIGLITSLSAYYQLLRST